MMQKGWNQDVLQHGQLFERPLYLEGSPHAQPCAGIRGNMGDVLIAKKHLAGTQWNKAGCRVEQCGLACSVGANQAQYALRRKAERDVIDGDDPTELHGDAFSSECYVHKTS